jgi:hypothetical protein
MDIQTSIETAKVLYAKDLVKSIFPEDSWMSRSRDDSKYVNGKSVERSNVGGKPKVRRNKVSNKIEATRRTLVAGNYNIHEFSSDPELLIFTEESLSNPEMRSNAIDEHQKSINEQIGHFMKTQWAATLPAHIARTSGANRLAAGKAATGTRKKPIYDDFLAGLQIFLDQDLVPTDIMVPSSMFIDMLKIEEFTTADWVDQKAVPTGRIGSILGATVWSVSLGVHYSNAATPVIQELVPEDDGTDEGVTFAGGAANNLGIIMWNHEFVTRAKGSAKVFIDLDNAEAQGTLMSANCLAGGDKYRKDERGIVSIVEAVGA